MERSKLLRTIRHLSILAASVLLASMAANTSQAYTNYTGCSACHGDFRGPTSPKGTVFPSGDKHEMHRANANMATTCNLCHSGSSRTPVYTGISNGTANNQGRGCSGCHVGAGLRAHHDANGVTECYECHVPETSDPENVKPPYYGTPDTRADNPGNTVLATNINENWSVGDFLGLDNDGNNLYDLADYAVGPYRIVGVAREGNNVRVTWLTAGGRTNRVQTAGAVTGSFTNLGAAMGIPGVGLFTTNYVHVGGATNAARFYRLKSEDF